jgi:hypothetical protein
VTPKRESRGDSEEVKAVVGHYVGPQDEGWGGHVVTLGGGPRSGPEERVNGSDP